MHAKDTVGRLRPAYLAGCCLALFAGACLARTPATSADTCPQMALAARALPAPSRAPVAGSGGDCLVAAAALDAPGAEIVDLRERERFLAFHVPGARQGSLTELMVRPGGRDRAVVLYDGGRFHADALQLCTRLRHAGLRKARVVDGGIAAWAQLHDQRMALTVNRLADAEVAAALGEPGSQAIALSSSLRFAVRGAHTSPPGRRIVLADAGTPASRIQPLLGKGWVTFYWIGSARRLHELLDTQLAQERKRLQGPGVRNTCSAL
jgi:rhodanese-related sulfurtransferase